MTYFFTRNVPIGRSSTQNLQTPDFVERHRTHSCLHFQTPKTLDSTKDATVGIENILEYPRFCGKIFHQPQISSRDDDDHRWG